MSSGPTGQDVPKSTTENQATESPEPRQDGEGEGEGEGDITEQVAAPAAPATPPATPIIPASPSDDLALRLQDAGQGSQPLRLLKCGHVFHVSPPLRCLLVYSHADDLLLKENVCGSVVTRCIGTVSGVPAAGP